MKHTITIVFALILAASGLTSSHAQAPIRGNILAQIFVKNSTSLALKLNLEFWKRGDYFVSPVTEMEFRKSGNTTLLRIRRGTGDDWVSLDVNTIQRIDFNVMDKPVPGPVPPGTGGPTTEPSPGTTGAREKVFVDPKLNGRYINNCLTWATNCGKPAADYFCQQNGFVEAASFNIINLRPTLVMGDGKVCDESGCGGFSRIVCAGRSSGPEVNNPPPESPPSVGTGTREKVFVDPKLNGRYINNCLTWATNCGKPAADYFCQQNGFVEAASFNIINLRPTLVMGDGKVCDESGCGGFSRIVCVGRPALR